MKKIAFLFLILILIPMRGLDARSGSPVGRDIYALDADNTLWLRRACGPLVFRREIPLRVPSGESVIGIDFRPADGQLYALTDAGNLYLIDTTLPKRGNASLVSSLTPRFAGGVQSLMDFNPVVDAIRLIGSNDQNFAVVNLNQAVTQTAITYAAGDVNAGVDPNIVGGAYTNNVAGATTTIFYGLDFDLDTLITFPVAANGSSATGAGQAQTIGSLKTQSGNPFNISPTADLDILTVNGRDTLIGVSGRSLFMIDLAQINPTLQLGQTQDVIVSLQPMADGGLIDLAIDPKLRRCFGN